MNLYDKIQATAAHIQQGLTGSPQVGIILGSGIGALSGILTVSAEIAYTDIPGFPVSTVDGHDGKLVFGRIGDKDVVCMAGRFHYYEGYSMEEVTFPVRVMKALGVDTLFVSNAAGGMNPYFRIGDIMAITDHVHLFPENPLRGPNDDRLGIRFPDMSRPYDAKLLALADQVADQQKLRLREGTYIGLSGPTFETPAEYKWLRTIGGDAVGMSTTPEVIVARHAGMRVFAASIITDLGVEGHVATITHEEVLEAATAAAPKLAALMAAMIDRM